VSGGSNQKDISKDAVTTQQRTNNVTPSTGKTTVKTECGTKDTSTKSDRSENQSHSEETKKSEKECTSENTEKQPHIVEMDKCEKQPNLQETDNEKKQLKIEETNKVIGKTDNVESVEQLEKDSSPSEEDTTVADNREASEQTRRTQCY
jgi:hypothetical protein